MAIRESHILHFPKADNISVTHTFFWPILLFCFISFNHCPSDGMEQNGNSLVSQQIFLLLVMQHKFSTPIREWSLPFLGQPSFACSIHSKDVYFISQSVHIGTWNTHPRSSLLQLPIHDVLYGRHILGCVLFDFPQKLINNQQKYD